MPDQIEKLKSVLKQQGKPFDEGQFALFVERYKEFWHQRPINVVELAKALGIEVFLTSTMKPEESGAIVLEPSTGKYKVFINNSVSPRRRRFTLAHEIAHWISDTDFLMANGEIVETQKNAGKLFRSGDAMPDKDMVWRDIRANKFAAELLMPEDAFIELWEKLDSAEKVAECFDVSPQAAKVRASVVLGVIPE